MQDIDEPTPSDLPSSLLCDIRRLVDDARAVLLDQLELLALETRRAVRALGHIAAYGIAAGLLMACTWVGLSVAGSLWLMEHGTRPSMAVLAAALMDAAGSLILLGAIKNASIALTFPFTRESLHGDARADTAKTMQ
jgi:hypothetical protein